MYVISKCSADQTEYLKHSSALIEAADELGIDVSQITPVELLEYPHEDLPEGPTLSGGNSADTMLATRSESETRRLAEIGRKLVDASRKSRGLST